MDGQPSLWTGPLSEPGPFLAEVPQASVMAVPLEVQGDRAAALCVTRSEHRSPFAAEDLTLLSEFAKPGQSRRRAGMGPSRPAAS